MFIELQLSAEGRRRCVSTPSLTSTSTDATGPRADQGIAVYMVDIAKLEGNGPTLRPVFNVSASVENKVAGQAGAVSLRYALHHIDFGLLNAVISSEDRNRIESMARRYQLPPTTVDLSSLSSIAPGGTINFAALNAGITCGGQRLPSESRPTVTPTSPPTGSRGTRSRLWTMLWAGSGHCSSMAASSARRSSHW